MNQSNKQPSMDQSINQSRKMSVYILYSVSSVKFLDAPACYITRLRTALNCMLY